MIRALFLYFFAFCVPLFFTGCSGKENTSAVSAKTIESIKITSFPERIDSNCRNGQAKIFDECADQSEIFAQARARAKIDNKVVLISYGSEWCIWCHVFDAYINGDIEKFTYTYGDEGSNDRYTKTMRERANRDVSQEAYDLKKFVSENFVVAHIEYEHSSYGDRVLSQAGAWDYYDNGLPFVFTVDNSGKFAASFSHDQVEVRRDSIDWYRGYDRARLLEQLKAMREAAASQ